MDFGAGMGAGMKDDKEKGIVAEVGANLDPRNSLRAVHLCLKNEKI
jgi:hypothetical protein